MTKQTAIKKLNEAIYQYESSILDGSVDNPDIHTKEALEDNKEVVEALKMAIRSLSR